MTLPNHTPNKNPCYTAIIKEENGWWIGWIQEVAGVNCQERTRESLIETLRITLREFIEDDAAILAQAAEYERIDITL